MCDMLPMRFPMLVASLLLGTAVLACSIAGDDASSHESDHTEGRPTYAQYKWLWADETEEDFKKNAAAESDWSRPEFLPIDHPMAKRLQFWIDQMDAALRAKVRGALENTPKPQIILRKESDPNAWVTFMPISWDVGARVTRPKPDAAPEPPLPDAGPADAGAD